MTRHELDPDDLAGWIYTVYCNPADYPGKFVVRRFDRVTGAAERLAWAVGDTLNDARKHIPPWLACISRAAEDDPVIVESWL